MTTEKIKELYATGDWISIMREPSMNMRWEKLHWNGNKLRSSIEIKLIHKKHSDVLDHVLKGGLVEVTFKDFTGNTTIQAGNEYFFRAYSEDNDYKIIKDKPSLDEQVNKSICRDDLMSAYDKPSLNGHYCLATKLHYDKLVEDGCKPYDMRLGYPRYPEYVYIWVSNNHFIFSLDDIPIEDIYDLKPMHLYSNEWVFGRLEHEENDEYEIIKDKPSIFFKMGGIIFDDFNKRKEVECITREEIMNRDNWMTEEDDFLKAFSEYKLLHHLNIIANRLEYLEANQKGK